jgi:hypothetical protein
MRSITPPASGRMNLRCNRIPGPYPAEHPELFAYRMFVCQVSVLLQQALNNGWPATQNQPFILASMTIFETVSVTPLISPVNFTVLTVMQLQSLQVLVADIVHLIAADEYVFGVWSFTQAEVQSRSGIFLPPYSPALFCFAPHPLSLMLAVQVWSELSRPTLLPARSRQFRCRRVSSILLWLFTWR